MTVPNEILQNGKRRMNDAFDTELTNSNTMIDTTKTNEKPVKKKRKYTKTEFQPLDPSKLSYSLINLTPEDDDTLFTNILNDPIRGYFYYENLGFQLSSSFRYFIKKSGFVLLPKFAKHLKFQNWDEFIENFRLTAEDRETLKQNARFFDIFQIATSAIKYRRVLIEFLNSVYIGYTKGFDQMNSELSQCLINYIPKDSSEQKNMNNQYYKILCEEFNSFFNFNTGLGNSLNTFITREPMYISNGNNLYVKNLHDSLKWTAEEKDIFYEALARYSINRVDEISLLLPNKSTADVMNLYDTLQKELKRYKSDNSLKKKLIPYDDLPIAYEMSDEYINIEEKFAISIEKLDEKKNGTCPGEYRDDYYNLMETRCNELFNLSHLKKILQLFNDIETLKNANFFENDNDQDCVKTQSDSIVDSAIFDLYNIVRDFTFELIQRLFIKKVNKLSILQQLEWINFLKVFEKPSDPKGMVRILDLANINKTVDEQIDYFDSSSSYSFSSSSDDSGSSAESDDDNNFYPELTMKEYRMINETDPNGVEINPKLDIWRLGITKEDVQEVTNELLQENGMSDKLYKQLSGKMKFNSSIYEQKLENKISGTSNYENMTEDVGGDESSDENNSDEEKNHSTLQDVDDFSTDDGNDDGYSDSDYKEDKYDEDTDYDGDDDEENSNNKHADISDDQINIDEDHELESLENDRNIDDLPSDSEINAFIDRQRDTKVKKKNANNKNNLEFTYKWYDKEFIVSDMQNPNKLQNSQIYTGLDLTVKGNEYLQKLCDSEEIKLDTKDYMDSLKYENVYLTQLTSFKQNDLVNREFADVLSNIELGSMSISENSWRQVAGGPPALFNNNKIQPTVYSLVDRIKSKQRLRKYQVDDKELEQFRFTYNDY